MMEKRKELFAALGQAMNTSGIGGIGTLSEKTIHKTVKFYLEPDREKHEIPYLGSVADILNENGITEIQTKAFEHLRPKLSKFLPELPVSVVCPLPFSKYITTYTDGEPARKKSPRQKGLSDAAIELYKIKEFIGHENLSVRLLFLEVEEERTLISKGKRPRYKKDAAYPTAILKEITLKSTEDYKVFLPDSLPECFLSKDYYKAIRARAKYSYYALKLCKHLGFVKITGKKGNAFIYTRGEK